VRLLRLFRLRFAPAVPVSEMSAGGDHTCALRVGDGVAICWGNNDWGQLGSTVVVDEIAVVEGQPWGAADYSSGTTSDGS